MQEILDDIAQVMSTATERGQVADYIPELAAVNPNQFAISVALPNGQTYSSGCAQQLFSIQSISKVFSLTLAFG